MQEGEGKQTQRREVVLSLSKKSILASPEGPWMEWCPKSSLKPPSQIAGKEEVFAGIGRGLLLISKRQLEVGAIPEADDEDRLKRIAPNQIARKKRTIMDTKFPQRLKAGAC